MITKSLLVIAFVGVLVWLLLTYVPMPRPIQIVLLVFATAILAIQYIAPLLGVSLP